VSDAIIISPLQPYKVDYCDEYVCLSVLSHNLKTMRSNFTIFYPRDAMLANSLNNKDRKYS